VSCRVDVGAYVLERFDHRRAEEWQRLFWQYIKIAVANFVHLAALCVYVIFFREVPANIQPVLSFGLCTSFPPPVHQSHSHKADSCSLGTDTRDSHLHIHQPKNHPLVLRPVSDRAGHAHLRLLGQQHDRHGSSLFPRLSSSSSFANTRNGRWIERHCFVRVRAVPNVGVPEREESDDLPVHLGAPVLRRCRQLDLPHAPVRTRSHLQHTRKPSCAHRQGKMFMFVACCVSCAVGAIQLVRVPDLDQGHSHRQVGSQQECRKQRRPARRSRPLQQPPG